MMNSHSHIKLLVFSLLLISASHNSVLLAFQDDGAATDESSDARKVAMQAYEEGVTAQQNGKLNDALRAFERAIEADPKSPEPVRARALLLMRLGRVRQARVEARKAIALDKDDYETRVQLAVLLLGEQRNPADVSNITEAAKLLEEALASQELSDTSREFVNIHAIRGRLYAQARAAARAAESYSVLLEALRTPEKFGLNAREHQKLLSDRATGFMIAGQIMLEVGRYDEAIEAFESQAQLNEDDPGIHHFWLALAQYRKDDLRTAEENLNRYFETQERSPQSLQLLSDLYDAASKSDQAIPRLRELSKDATDAEKVELFIGALLIDRGEGAEAEKIFRRVIGDSGDPAAWLGLIRVAIARQAPAMLVDSIREALAAGIPIQQLVPIQQLILNDPGFGQKVVQACIDEEPSKPNPVATFYFSDLASSEKLDLPELEAVLLKRAIAQQPALGLGIEVKSRLGINLFMRNENEEAADTFRDLLAIPQVPGEIRLATLFRLSVVESASGNFEAALTAINEALDISPQAPQLIQQLGLVQLQLDQYAEAEQTLSKAIDLLDGNPAQQGQARIYLAGLYSQMRRWDEAIAAYNELLQMPDIEPDMARRGRSLLSNAHVQNGNLPAGEKVLEEVYAETPDDPGVNNDLGYLYADQNKKLDQAEKMIRIAVEAEPENPAYLDSLGWVLFRLGRFDEALIALEKANADPDYRDSTIIEHLGDVQLALKNGKDARETWQEALDVEKVSSAPSEEVIKRIQKKLDESE